MVAHAERTPPNILLIVSEDHGPELGCYGEPHVRTPNLDALARAGVRFEAAYVTQAGCSPSRASILTGLYPHQNGQIGLATWGFRMYSDDLPTIPGILREAGYRTGIIGKLHVNPASAFDFDLREISQPNFRRRNLAGYARTADRFFGGGDEPFFLMVNYPDAHRPFLTQVDGMPTNSLTGQEVKPLAYMGLDDPRLRRETADHYNSIMRLDTLIGDLLGVLEKSGKADNTLVIYLSDHGADLLRGKVSAYEGGLRVPLIVSWPGGIKADQVRSELVSAIDLFPTLLEATGAAFEGKLPGRSLLPLLRGEEVLWRDYLFAQNHLNGLMNYYPQRVVRDSRYKLIHNLNAGTPAGRPNLAFEYVRNRSFYKNLLNRVLQGDDLMARVYRLMSDPPVFELYDLKTDPYEFNNLSNDEGHQPVLERLQRQLANWQEETDDPLRHPANLRMLNEEIAQAISENQEKSADSEWDYLRYFRAGTRARSKGAATAPRLAEPPVVRWTAMDAPDFRYHFLDDVRRTQLLYATPETGTFNLHGFLAYHKEVLFASWDNHARDENKSGQRGVFRYSLDEGETWSEVRVLFPPLAPYEPGTRANRENPFQTSQGFVELHGRLYAVTCVDKALIDKVYRFNEVSRTRVGLLAREVGADATLGDIFWLSERAPQPEPGFPAYPAGDPELVAKINDHFTQPAHLPQLLFKPRQWPDSDDEHRMTEPTQPWRLDDGTWVRLWRDQGSIHARNRAEINASRPRRHYASFSFDDGRSWTVPTRTNFRDTGARSNAGRLPDKQNYVINNPLPMDGRQGGRALLAISLSRDGLHFDRIAVLAFLPPSPRYEGIAKGAPGYQYPHSIVIGEHLWVIYAISKEDIEVARIPLSTLYGIDSFSHSPLQLNRRQHSPERFDD